MTAPEIIAIIAACLVALLLVSWLIKTGWIDIQKWKKNAAAAKEEFEGAKTVLEEVPKDVAEVKDINDELKEVAEMEKEVADKLNITTKLLLKKKQAKRMKERLQGIAERQEVILADNVDLVNEDVRLKEQVEKTYALRLPLDKATLRKGILNNLPQVREASPIFLQEDDCESVDTDIVLQPVGAVHCNYRETQV